MGFTGEQALHSASEHYSAPGTAGTGQQEPCRGGSSTRQLHGAVSKHSHAAEASGNTVWGEGGERKHSRLPPPTVKRRGRSRAVQSPPAAGLKLRSATWCHCQGSNTTPAMGGEGVCAHGCSKAPHFPLGWHPAAGQGAVATLPGLGGSYLA